MTAKKEKPPAIKQGARKDAHPFPTSVNLDNQEINNDCLEHITHSIGMCYRSHINTDEGNK